MKRKIAAIMAADIAGYSRLVAEDEEETLRRLASYRAVIDDFIAKASGRIFNTAGDAVLAEFSSAVEAVRCAIDIQESLRTRNLAYPPSRQMNFRIGITIGDVVERDGDLLGDGVNIAARLEGLAQVGGICVSRTVYEQVANKLSVQFADIGEQQVKNIPTPVHAFMVAMRGEDGRLELPKPKRAAKAANWPWPAAIALGSAAVIAVAAVIYFAFERNRPPTASVTPAPATATIAPVPAPAATPPVAEPRTAAAPAAAAPPQRAALALVPEAVPFVADRARQAIRDEYFAAPDHRALAISNAAVGYITGQPDDEAAKERALEICQKRADTLPIQRKCELYAVGNTVVSIRHSPPLPPQPWLTRDTAIERPFSLKELPIATENGKANIERTYMAGRKPKALAMSPRGQWSFFTNQDSVDEAVRRALEVCGNNNGVACMIVSVDDLFVVPLPTTMKPVNYFRNASPSTIAIAARNDALKRLSDNPGGWSAVAVGASGKVGLATKADKEETATAAALADCARQDTACRVIAIGPFAVEPH
jgi:class 3 adenylate cyclase